MDEKLSTIVTETYDCSRAPADERASMDDGRIWVKSMTETLQRLSVSLSHCESHEPCARHP